MKGNISKFLRSSLAFVMALSIGFTTVNAQTPLAEVDSTLFREIVTIPDGNFPEYYKEVTQEELHKVDIALQEINDAAIKKANEKKQTIEKSNNTEDASVKADNASKSEPTIDQSVAGDVVLRTRIAEKIFVTKDTQNKKVYRVYGTYDGQNPGFYEIDKDFETLKSNEKIDIDKEREAFVPKDDKPNEVMRPKEEITNDAISSGESEDVISLSASEADFEEKTPTSVPSYYTGPTNQDRKVYKFVGRDGFNYYRVYGSLAGENEGFYASDQYGLGLEISAPIDLSIEDITLAPYRFKALPVEGTVPFPKDDTISGTAGYDVYKYETNISGQAYRSYGVIENISDVDSTKGWHRMTSQGKYDTTYGNPISATIKSIDKEYLNLAKVGFIESTVAPTKQSYYDGPSEKSTDNTITPRKYFYSFTGKDGVGYSRVHGTYNGTTGFFDGDSDGNVNYPAKLIDLKWEDENLKPIERKPGGDLKDAPNSAIIQEVKVTSIVDGTPDGSEGWDANNEPGNDSGPGNGIVRSFDTITYNYSLDMITRPESEYTSFETVDVFVEYILPVTKEIAEFDLSSMKTLNNPVITEKDGSQILTGSYKLTKGSDPNVIPGVKTVIAIVKVNGAINGQKIEPVKTFWLNGNNPKTDGKKITPNATTVSAAPKYSVQIKPGGQFNTKKEFDFSTGNSTETQNSNSIFGRMYNYGLSVQLYNDRVSKGLKGIELPQGPIEVDLSVKLTKKELNKPEVDIINQMTPTLWDYKLPNASHKGQLNRNMFWDSVSYSFSINGAMPGWDPNGGGTPGGMFKNPVGKVTASQANDTIKVVFDNYDFDTSKMEFAVREQGNALSTVIYGKNIGNFTGAHFQLITPLPRDAVENDVEFFTEVRVKSFEATSKSGEKTNKNIIQQPRDVSYVKGVTPQVIAGSIVKENYFWDKNGTSRKGNLSSNWDQPDAFISVSDKQVQIVGSVVPGSNDDEMLPHSFNLLQKFDDKAFEAAAGSNGSPHSVAYAAGIADMKNIRVLYAAKPDKSGWKNYDEMKNAKEQDLVYFSTIGELKSSGYTNVGVLFEGREGWIGRSTRFDMTVLVDIKDTVNIGDSFATTNFLRAWVRSNDIPDELTMLNNDPKNPTVFPPSSLNDNRTYVKALFDSNGQVVSGTHTGGIWGGNTIAIVGNNAKITKKIDQVDSKGKPKENFVLDNNERIVDYVLAPSLSSPVNPANPGMVKYDDLVIRDYLPYGVKYMPGSSNQGGVYSPSGGPLGSGVVTGGKSIEPKIETSLDSKGREVQILTWELNEVPVNSVVEKIRYSVFIGDDSDPNNDVSNNDTFINKATITSKEDGKPLKETNGNISSSTFKVSKSGKLSFTKTATKNLAEINEPIEFKITYSNSSNAVVSPMKALDILPFNGDWRESKFNGTYEVDNIKVDYTNATTKPVKIYYTTDETVQNHSVNVSNIDVSNWEEISPTGSGKNYSYNLGTNINPTAFYFEGDISAMTGLKISYSLKVINNQPADTYGNDFTVTQGTSAGFIEAPYVKTSVARRTVSGIAWFDSNRNGQRDPNEALLANVGVQLVDADGKIVTKNLLGESLVGKTTNSRGVYEFDNLAAGTYVVKFVSNRNFDMGKYEVTEKQAAGVPAGLNSDATGILNGSGILQEAIIDSIVLPELSTMKDLNFVSGNNDIGLFYPYSIEKSASPEGKLSGTPGELPQLKEGDLVTYTLTIHSPRGKLNNVIVGDTLPEGMSFVPGSIRYKLGNAGAWIYPGDRAYHPATRTVGWELNEVPQGDSVFEFQVVVDKLPEGVKERNFGNHGVLKSGGDPTTSIVVEHKAVSRSAAISKTAALVTDAGLDPENRGTSTNPVPTNLSQTVEYRLTVKNTGSEGLLSDVISVDDVIPEGVTYVPGSMKTVFRDSATQNAYVGTQATFTQTEPTQTNNALKWELNKMGSGEEAYLTFRVVAPSTTLTDTDPQTYEKQFENTAVMKDIQKEGTFYKEDFIDKDGVTHNVKDTAVYTETEITKNSETTYHKVAEPNVKIVKSSNPADGSVVKGGDVITYTIAVTNDGKATAKNVKITDPIPAGVVLNEDGKLTSDHANTESKVENGEAVWNITDLEAGATVTVTYQVVVQPLQTVGEKSIENTAYVSLNELPKIPSETIKHKQSMNYTIVKESNPVHGTTVNGKDIIKYSIKISNTDTEPLKNLVITDAIPEFTNYVAGSIASSVDATKDDTTSTLKWTIEELAGKSVATVSFDVEVQPMEAEGSRTIENTGYYQFDGIPTPKPTNTIEHNQGIHYTFEKFSDPASGSLVDGPETIKYTLRVKNTGSSTINALNVWDSIPEFTEYKVVEGYPNLGGKYEAGGDHGLGKISWTVEDLAPNETVDLIFNVTVDRLVAGDVDSRDVPNTAYSQLPKETTPKESTVVHKQKFGYEIVKTSDIEANTYVDGNQEIEYTITLRNLQHESLDNVVIRDAIPSYTTYVEGSMKSNRADVTESLEAGVPTWKVAEVEKDGVVEVSFKVRVNPMTQIGSRNIVNEAEYIIDGMPEYEKTNKITHHQEAAFTLVKSSDVAENTLVDGKQVITYTLDVTNSGKQTLNDLRIEDMIPEFTKYVENSITSTGSGTITPKAEVGKVSWKLDNFKVGDNAKLIFKVTVDPLTVKGEREIANQAQGQLPDDGIPTKTNIIKHKQMMDYEVRKTSTPGNGIVNAGDEIQYFIAVENKGHETLRGVEVTDKIPTYTTYVEGSQSVDPTTGVTMTRTGDTLKWVIDEVTTGETTTPTFKVTVDEMKEVGKREILNAAQYVVEPDTPEETPETKHEQGIKYTLVKSSNPLPSTPEAPSYVNGGDVITYILKLENIGESTINDLNVTDAIPEFTTFVAGSMKHEGNDDAVVVMSQDGDVLKWNVSNLEPQTALEMKFDVTVNPLSVDGESSIKNVAYSGFPDIPTVPTDEVEHKQKLEYAVVKSADVAEGLVNGNDIITYTLTITNSGEESLVNFMLKDKIPANTEYVDGSIESSSGTKLMEVVDGVAYWTVNEIAKNSVETVSFKVKVNEFNKTGRRYIINVGQYKLETAPVYKNTNTINHEQQSEFSIEKTSDVENDTTVKGNDTITYTLKFTNVGNETINNGIIRDVLPNEVELVENGIRITKPDSTVVQDITDVDGKKWSIEGLKTDETVEIHIPVTVKPLLEVGTRTIENTAFGKLKDEPDERPTNTIIHHQDLSYNVVKDSTPVSGSYVAGNEEIEYRINVHNTGSEPIKSIRVTDVIPTHTKYVAGSITDSGEATVVSDDSTETLSWDISNLAGKTSTAVSFKVTADDMTAIGERVIENIAQYKMNEEPVKETNKIIHNQKTDYEIHKTSDPVDGVVDGGSTIRYILSVENTGEATLNNLNVTDAIPTHTQYVPNSMKFSGGSGTAVMTEGDTLSWNVSGLKKGETMTLEFEVVVDALEANGAEQEILNTAYAKLPDDETPKESETTRHTQKLSYVVSKDAVAASGSYVDVDETIAYTITATNTGNQTLRNLTITDMVPEFTTFVPNSMKIVSGHVGTMSADSPLTWNIEAVAVGESVQVSFEVKANAMDTKGERKITNIGYVTLPKDPEPTPTNPVEHLQKLSYEFHKDSTPASGTYVTGGDVITYNLTLINTGETSVHNLVATDTVPEGTVFVEGSQTYTGGSATAVMSKTDDKLQWNVDGLKKGETMTLSFKVTVKDLGTENERTIRNVAYSNLPGVPPDPTEEVEHKQDRSYKFNKSSDPVTGSFVTAGDEITYSLTVVNTGEETLSKLNVKDAIPEGTTYVENSQTFDDQSSGTATMKLEDGTLYWEVNGVKKDETMILSFKVTVNELGKDDNRSIKNVAYANFPEIPEVPTEEVEHKQERSFEIHKTSNPATGGYVTAGDEITYSLTVVNTGEETLNKLNVRDAIPEGTTYVENSQTFDDLSSGTATMKLEDGTLYWEVNGVKKDETMILSFKVTVNELGNDNTRTIKNVAYANFPEIPEVPTEEVIHKQDRSYEFHKTSNPKNGTIVKAGDEITYFLSVVNTGEETLNKLNVSDAIPAGTTFVENSQAADDVSSATTTPSFENGKVNWVIDGLKAGETITLSFKVTVNPLSTQGSNSIRNVAFANLPGEPPVPSEETNHKQKLSYEIEKVSNPISGSMVNGKDDITYTIKVKNTGDQVLKDLMVKDTVPTFTKYVQGTQQSSHTATMSVEGDDLFWTIGEIGVGETAEASFTVKVDPMVEKGTRDITNIGYVKLPADKEYTPTNQTIHRQSASYEAHKSSDPKSGTVVNNGDVITYSISVNNTGSDTLFDMLVTDAVPANTKLVASSISSSNPDVVTSTESNGVINWTIKELKSGEEIVVSFKVTVALTKENATIRNVATTKLPGEPEVPTEEIIHPTTSSYKISKESNPVSGTQVKTGDTIKYTINVENTGSTVLTNFEVKDTIPELTEYVANSVGSSVEGTQITEGSEIHWIIPEIKPGERVNVSFEVKVKDVKDLKEAEIINVAYGKSEKEREFKPTNEVKHPIRNEKPTLPQTGMGTNPLGMQIAMGGLLVVLISLIKRRKEETE
ncbi:DUF7507 domain-containing protein [Erysipelothrix anatis]|uniref:DUF7927 domain-containing protein n=1 Tax=Erysipelothrix anatis TaxID=2683713 RepID=UPI00140B08CD|nr:SdrD B-like domain-containing protein [Erysipelothrix anatis]